MRKNSGVQWLLFDQANELYLKGEYHAALKQLRVILLNEDLEAALLASIHRRIADCETNLGNPKDALQSLDLAEQCCPLNNERIYWCILISKISAHAALGNYGESIKLCKEAVEITEDRLDLEYLVSLMDELLDKREPPTPFTQIPTQVEWTKVERIELLKKKNIVLKA